MHARRPPWLLAVFTSIACATVQPRPIPRDTVAAEPVSLAYADLGVGSPIVFVHGAYGDLRTFARALPLLASKHRVIVPSLRYHWPNPWPAANEEAYRNYTVENHARDLAALIARLGVAPVDLVGHSYGGNIAAILARSRPELVRRVVLLEPALRWMLREVPGGDEMLAEAARPREALLARLRGGEEPLSVLRSVFDGNKPGAFDAIPASTRIVLVDNARLVGPYTAHPGDETRFTCDDARAVRQPILLVRGERTGRDFREIVARFAACLPEAQAVVLEGSRHAIQVDAPEAMARTVVEFLSR